MPQKPGPSRGHPGAPPPPPISAQHSAGAQEGFAEVTSTLATSHHQLLERRNCPFKHLRLSSGTPPPKYCDTGFSKREELPLINDSELKWGGVRRLCSHLSQKTGEPVPETMGAEQEQGVGQGLILEPSQQPGF